MVWLLTLQKSLCFILSKEGGFWRFFGNFNAYNSKTAQPIYQPSSYIEKSSEGTHPLILVRLPTRQASLCIISPKRGGFSQFFGIFNPCNSITAQPIYQQLMLRWKVIQRNQFLAIFSHFQPLKFKKGTTDSSATHVTLESHPTKPAYQFW